MLIPALFLFNYFILLFLFDYSYSVNIFNLLFIFFYNSWSLEYMYVFPYSYSIFSFYYSYSILFLFYYSYSTILILLFLLYYPMKVFKPNYELLVRDPPPGLSGAGNLQKYSSNLHPDIREDSSLLESLRMLNVVSISHLTKTLMTPWN